MGNVLGNLKPTAIWNHFEKICSIPHPSTHEKKIAEYVRDFGKSCGLESTIDEAGNVIIRKPATKGMENRRGVVFQTHLDMVPQKNQDVKHDFPTDPIRPRIEGDLVKATGTTLGADNGIGVATVLAVLEAKDLTHGPIEALFTIDEEQGMTGAEKLKPGLLKGDILINLDNEDEGELCIGCAGGCDAIAKLTYKEESVPTDSVAYKVDITGLKGGHSGVDIQLNRGNANKVLNRILYETWKETALRIAKIEGGDLRNAIPRWAWAVVTVPKGKAELFTKKAATVTGWLKGELKRVDPELTIKVEKADLPGKVMDASATERLIRSVYACPHGAFALLPGMPNVAETSTNLAIIKSENGVVKIHSMLRSSIESMRPNIAAMIRNVFELAGAEVEVTSGYPGWEPYFESPVLAALKEVYKKKFGKEAKISATHGGLECGIIRSKYPTMDAISFGPTIRFPHSPDEQLNIPSVEKFWTFVTEVLKEIPKK
ncbi:MAG: aminoacyl-histidine dipeptidase [Pseudomonadota bacterium]